MINFFKYQGTGNDFVMIDNRSNDFDNQNIQLIQRICSRRFGVGADGLILIENSEATDFYVNYFNADGSKSFCGNGARCAVAFARDIGIIVSETVFDAIDGIHEAKIADGLIHLKMGDVDSVEVGTDYYFIDTGSPHYMKFVEDLDDWDIYDFGRQIRYSDKYKEEGTNVNLIQQNENGLTLRTYERGVENETYSCGTGATAVALAHMFINEVEDGKIPVEVKGGNLEIKAIRDQERFRDIWLIGPGEKVFEGLWKDT